VRGKDGTEVKGTWPEVSHEIEDDGDEYRVSIIISLSLSLSCSFESKCISDFFSLFETAMTSANLSTSTPIYN